MKNYNEYTTKELKAEAKEKKVANWWTLRKEALVEELTKKAEAEEAAAKKTGRNAKRGTLIEWNGKALNVCGWAKELGVNANTLYARLYVLNWGVEKTLTTAAKAAKTEA